MKLANADQSITDRQKSNSLPVQEAIRCASTMSFSSLPKSLLVLSLGIALGASTTYLLTQRPLTSQSTITIRTPRPQELDDSETVLTEDIVDGIEGLIGSTKLVRIRSLSLATGCEILAKAEVPLPSPFPSPSLPGIPFSGTNKKVLKPRGITKRSRSPLNSKLPFLLAGQQQRYRYNLRRHIGKYRHKSNHDRLSKRI
jgi:hypothetical protein